MKVCAIRIRPYKHPFPILAWIIMLFQGMNPFKKSSYSHFAIMYQEGNRVKVIDVTSRDSVDVEPSDLFFKRYKMVGAHMLPPPTSAKLFNKWIGSIRGTKYDKLQLVGLILKLIGFISFNKIGHNYKKMTCNEIVLNYLERFTDLKFGDPDNYDLLMTEEVILSLHKEK